MPGPEGPYSSDGGGGHGTTNFSAWTSPTASATHTTSTSIPTVISSPSITSPLTANTYDPDPSPILTTPSSPGVTVTVPITSITSAATSTASPSDTRVNHSLDGATLAEILVPIIVVIALIPLLYLCYLRRRHKPGRRGLPELHLPQETALLHSRNDSVSRFTPSPFSDTERVRSNSLGLDDSFKPHSLRLSGRASSEIFRVPSPALPSPSQPALRAQESWPLTSVQTNSAPTQEFQTSSLRPPSSIHDRVSNRSRTASLTEGYPSSYRASDTISELSFDHGSRERRTRDLDEMSFVSALESDDAGERNLHGIV